ncbi:MAG: DUF3501 family protein [Fimbriiglobus sp.]
MPAAISLQDFATVEDPALAVDFDTENHFRYLREHRRIPLGTSMSAVFENRDTLWFRLRELARVANLTSRRSVQQELGWYNQLVSQPQTLVAAIWLGGQGRSAMRRFVSRGHLAFRDAFGHEIPGHFRTDRVTDPLIGLAGWVEFKFSDEDLEAFATPGHGWHLLFQSDTHNATSDILPDTVWDSLRADLGVGFE